MEERVQKILARAGFGSRRHCEELISSGRIRVNGRVSQLGEKADGERDVITIDGRKINSEEKTIYILLYKPRKVISTTSDPENRATVRDLIPVMGTLYPVGRLDADSEGLILLTNDGPLTNRLTHPRFEHEKEYHVLVARNPDDEQLKLWRKGMVLRDGYHTHPAKVRLMTRNGRGAWLSVILKEGHKRQIREMGIQTGLPVVRIIRVRMANIQLGSLKPKEWRYLTPYEVTQLQKFPENGNVEVKEKM
jgi:23S rRNA pseudouridine2605 synthase